MKILLAALVTASLLSHAAMGAERFLEDEAAKAFAAGDPAAIVNALDKLVDSGNVVAATELGLMYRDGKGVPRDHVKARKFLKIAAAPDLIRMWYKYGIPKAQYALAIMIRDGAGGKANASGAVPWLERAAEQGELQAQLDLARMYFNGTGIDRDPERAFIWASIAAGPATGEAQKDMERIRDLSQKQLAPTRLARAQKSVSGWRPKTG